MSGHTPGPWAKCHDHPNPETAASVAHIRARTSMPGLEIATVYGCNSEPEQDANARIIAAAPELLEALNDALKEMLSCRCDGSDYAIAQARAAIAKATGAQP